jgi:hypothetical protein
LIEKRVVRIITGNRTVRVAVCSARARRTDNQMVGLTTAERIEVQT